MRIYDIHMHAYNTEPNPKSLLEQMEKAGVYGGCVFSNWPKECDEKIGTSFEERLSEVLMWTKGYEDRLFPVLWIHPYEENIIENINKAVNMGICAFKIICTDFYVYEEKSLEVLREIARLNKPVFFHTGILWDGKISSEYNRPLNWEALLDIKGLRFSMGHCSWPWIDECIALYGKFLNSLQVKETAEMFFDTTPGTPEIYREELLTKLWTIGYDLGNNVMFGTDASIHEYNAEWTTKWLDVDGKIFDKLGVSKACRENLYYNNLIRFLGKSEISVKHLSPECDNENVWSPCSNETPEIIEKWYKQLNFPKEYDVAFYKALKEIKISDATEIESFKIRGEDGRRNLLSILYMCEALEKKYEEKGISKEILYDTLSDIVIWLNIWSTVKNEFYLGETHWLWHHFNMKLFRLGRLEFKMAESEHNIPEKNIFKGDNIIEIHIPEGGALTQEECVKSIELAKKFFKKYYPEFEYKCFICDSWFLDTTLNEILSEESNIIKFQKMFEIVREEKSDSILKYVFRFDTTRINLKYMPCNSNLQQKIKKRIEQGGDFYESLGILKF